jgi:hypothetical protein
MTENNEPTIPKSKRIYRHCQNRSCQMRLKTRQYLICASCRIAGAWGMFVAGALVGLAKAVGWL